MDTNGYICLSDLLNWHKMKRELGVTFEEVIEEVGVNEKKRFGLLYCGKGQKDWGAGKEIKPRDMEHQLQSNNSKPDTVSADGHISTVAEQEEPTIPVPATAASIANTDEDANSTTFALKIATSSDPAIQDRDASHYLIRAVQGHSIQSLSEASYLKRIDLSDPTTIPSTVVHGTSRSAWPIILKSGGLKSMTRNHVHFATGPSLTSVLGGEKGHQNGSPNQNQNKDCRSPASSPAAAAGAALPITPPTSTVISGMRSSAEILIYINIHTAISVSGIPFWQSENGVVLSEGIEMETTSHEEEEEEEKEEEEDTDDALPQQQQQRRQKKKQTAISGLKQKQKPKQEKNKNIVPTTCWDVVVDISEKGGEKPGVVIWRNNKC